MDDRHGEFSDLARRDSLQLYVADLLTYPRGQSHRSLQVRLDAELESHRRGRVQVALRLDLLSDLPERHATGDHQQPALGRFQRSGEFLPGHQSCALVPVAVLRGLRAPRTRLLPRSTENDLPDHLDGGSRAQGLGFGLAGRRDRVHHSDGDLHTALQHTDGLHRFFHRYHALVHLALLLSSQAEEKFDGMERRRVRLLRHLPRCSLRRDRRLRFWLCADQRLRDRLTLLSDLARVRSFCVAILVLYRDDITLSSCRNIRF